jgi:hypothetical protein
MNYLALPYCAMPDRKWLAFTIILIWVLVLCIWIFSIVDFLCPNLVAMTDVCQMRESVAGVTFLAFGHGAPEVFDMVASALLDSNGMAMAIGQVKPVCRVPVDRYYESILSTPYACGARPELPYRMRLAGHRARHVRLLLRPGASNRPAPPPSRRASPRDLRNHHRHK